MDGDVWSLGNRLHLKQCCTNVKVTRGIWGSMGRTMENLRALHPLLEKQPKPHVLIQVWKHCYPVWRFLRVPVSFQVTARCLSTVHGASHSLVSPHYAVTFLYISVRSVCTLCSSGPSLLAVSFYSAFPRHALAYAHPSALFCLPLPGLQAAGLGLANCWEPFLFSSLTPQHSLCPSPVLSLFLYNALLSI